MSDLWHTTRMFAEPVPRLSCAVAAVVVASLTLAGCSRSETAQARGRDEAAKPVKTESLINCIERTLSRKSQPRLQAIVFAS